MHFLREFYKNHTSATPLDPKYQDETWTFEKGSGIKPRSWMTLGKSFQQRQATLGKRFIISHTGGAKGWVPNAGLFVKGVRDKNDDYHTEMNGETFNRHFKEDILANLKEPSLIIMDNAAYHRVQEEKQPTSNWRQRELKDWLDSNGVPYREGMTNADLLALARMHKVEPVLVTDKMVEGTGHKILRLPPYHSHWNPIELDPSQFCHIKVPCYTKYLETELGPKQFLPFRFHRTSNFTILGIKTPEQVWKDALETVTPEVWAECCNHTTKLILEAYENEVASRDEWVIHDNFDADDSDVDDPPPLDDPTPQVLINGLCMNLQTKRNV
ncbi:Protein FAM243A [Frankliniella fusca]|uniref:Protein FAM243A n=1 Tax=Frankliniella fusca TaxID=407009 RepID=A0AAE1I5I4_9NEOP|nr:Protein FAM243A [Frankliniella fusca]